MYISIPELEYNLENKYCGDKNKYIDDIFKNIKLYNSLNIKYGNKDFKPFNLAYLYLQAYMVLKL